MLLNHVETVKYKKKKKIVRVIFIVIFVDEWVKVERVRYKNRK